MYTADVSPDRHYHLQSEDANRRIDALLEQLRVPESTWPLYADLLTTALKMYEDGAGVADLRIANAAFKEIRYGFKVFAPWRNVPKITVFGSARTPRAHPVSEQAYAFSKRITGAGWMVITGAGGGVMSSAQEGAGGERSFGLNIRLPFEQEANPWIADDPKLVSFKYFFTRKLFLVREAHAMAFLPGGFGTADEAFEALTLIQTGKSPVLPLVMLDEPGGTYWKTFDEFVRREMVGARCRRTTPTSIASPTTWRRPPRRSRASTSSTTRSATCATPSCSASAGRYPRRRSPISTRGSPTS